MIRTLGIMCAISISSSIKESNGNFQCLNKLVSLRESMHGNLSKKLGEMSKH